MRSIFRYMASTKFTIVLLLLLVVGMLLGTLLPQGGTPEQYREAFGESLYKILSSPGLFNIFRSWWFIALAISLLVNLVAGNIYALWVEHQRDKHPTKSGTEIKVPPERIENITGIFKQMGFRCKQIGDTFFVARKGVAQRPLLVAFHLCLALLAIGFILSATSRFDDLVYLREGETKRIPFAERDSLDMTLEKFDMEYVWLHERYFPKDYKSTLSLSTGLRQIVEVNKPLKYRGLTIYQMDYEQRFDLAVGDTSITVTSREAFTIPGLPGQFRTGTVYLGALFRDNEHQAIVPNTKLYLLGKEQGPPMMGRGQEIGELVLGKPFEFQNTMLEMKNVAEISGLFYRKDTGYPIVFYALILFMVGLFVRVLFPSYALRVYVDKLEGAFHVAGKASGIAADLDRLIARLKKTYGESPGGVESGAK